MYDDQSVMCEADNSEKHLELLKAIRVLDDALNNLNDLDCKVDGVYPDKGPCDPEAKDKEPSLSNVLNNSPDRIRKIANNINKSVEKLKSLLF